MEICEYMLVFLIYLTSALNVSSITSFHPSLYRSLRHGSKGPHLSRLMGLESVVHRHLKKRDATRQDADPASVLLEYSDKNCSGAISQNSGYKFTTSSYQRFTAQTKSALFVANILNNLYRTYESRPNSLYRDEFYYSLARATVESDPTILGCKIAFDENEYDRVTLFSPYVYRDKTSKELRVVDLGNITRQVSYTSKKVKGYEWFWWHKEEGNSSHRPVLEEFKRVCRKFRWNYHVHRKFNITTVTTPETLGHWSEPYYDCDAAKAWLITYSLPFFGCNKQYKLSFKGVVAIDIDVHRVDINQCPGNESVFSGTHRCRPTTQCVHVPGGGFRRGNYKCECKPGYYFPLQNSNSKYYNGSTVEKSYVDMINGQTDMLGGKNLNYNNSFQCLPCKKGCTECMNNQPCIAEYDVMLRGVPLGIQSFCMTIALVLGFVIIRLRTSKVMKASMWCMLEILLVGALLLYSTVVIQYFEPTNTTCLLIPWFREVGFSTVYGALILKVYRVLAEFQSRKAHRVHVRDKDLLKYLLGITLVVIGYMSAWTAINMDQVREGKTMLASGKTQNTRYTICKSHWWDYVIEVGEFLFLCLGVYLCYCVRSAPSDYSETRYISWAIYNETVVSALLHITRHFLWLSLHPDYIFLMYFVRCQLTVSVTLFLVLGPKLWYAHRPPEEDHFRNRAYSTSDVHDTILPESMKLHVGISSNGDVDVGEINLSEMDPEDIRAELKRLYTQLQIYKTKTMRKDNPHISKRRGGRKQTHRRFSLQAFHYKHRHHHHDDHEHELSKTPEESTNSAEGVSIAMDSVVERDPHSAPTVTFKPGHKTIN